MIDTKTLGKKSKETPVTLGLNITSNHTKVRNGDTEMFL